MSARDERIRVFGGSEGALPPGVFSISLRDVLTIGRHRAALAARRFYFVLGLMRGGLCWVTICWGLPVRASMGFLRALRGIPAGLVGGRFPTVWAWCVVF
jgi:hypothetical protein